MNFRVISARWIGVMPTLLEVPGGSGGEEVSP